MIVAGVGGQAAGEGDGWNGCVADGKERKG